MSRSVLAVKDLRTSFFTEGGVVPAVDGVTFRVDAGETLGIVGESGCGKSVTALSIMRLVADPPGRIVGGQIWLHERDLLKCAESEMRRVRGDTVAMIFQEPMTSLNPVYTVGDQIAEAIELHQRLDRRDAMTRAVEMLRTVGISLPERRVKNFPHQLSGGMRQRVMIAMALSCNPELLIADEPTTALDVTIQAQILDLMERLKDEFGTAIILITHDLGVIAEMAQRVIVMYAGRIVEEAPVAALFNSPLHPYTEGLLLSVPSVHRGKRRLHVIEGTVPNLLSLPKGCRFGPRCPYRHIMCEELEPDLAEISPSRRVACWRATGQLRPLGADS